MNITVFQAFKNAIVSDTYQIGKFKRGTVVGSQYEPINYMDVIVDVGTAADIGTAPNAEGTTADLLLYVKPNQLPTTHTRELVNGYMIHDTKEDAYYAIIGANQAKNQETGELEHVELLLKEAEVVVDE